MATSDKNTKILKTLSVTSINIFYIPIINLQYEYSNDEFKRTLKLK